MALTVAAHGTTMRAIARTSFGSPDILEVREVNRPVPADGELLVRVHAASVNPFDWHMLTGKPYLARIATGVRKPKSELLGVDFAGTVEAVGADVERFRPGDEVFGGRSGAFAEYVCVREDGVLAPVPAGTTFQRAAAFPMAAITALQGLRDKGQLQPGQRALINGASGGVGTFAVQIAKAFGADVTGVCSTDKVDIARSIGADDVVDYTREDFTRRDRRYDLMLDIAGNRSWSDCKRVLGEHGTLVIVGGPKNNRLVGSLGQAVKVRLLSIPGSRSVAAPFLANLNQEDLATLGEMLESGTLTPVIDRQYGLAEAADALRYVAEGHAAGKVVVNVADSS